MEQQEYIKIVLGTIYQGIVRKHYLDATTLATMRNMSCLWEKNYIHTNKSAMGRDHPDKNSDLHHDMKEEIMQKEENKEMGLKMLPWNRALSCL